MLISLTSEFYGMWMKLDNTYLA